MTYSNYCAFYIEKKAFSKNPLLYYYSPYSDSKLASTLMNPVTPPIFSSWNDSRYLTIPLGPGFVPTSNKTQI